MTLNPEELIVETFEPTSESYGSSAAIITDDPNHPTPQTYCFVCD